MLTILWKEKKTADSFWDLKIAIENFKKRDNIMGFMGHVYREKVLDQNVKKAQVDVEESR